MQTISNETTIDVQLHVILVDILITILFFMMNIVHIYICYFGGHFNYYPLLHDEHCTYIYIYTQTLLLRTVNNIVHIYIFTYCEQLFCEFS